MKTIEPPDKRTHLAYTYVFECMIGFRYFCGCRGNENVAIWSLLYITTHFAEQNNEMNDDSPTVCLAEHSQEKYCE